MWPRCLCTRGIAVYSSRGLLCRVVPLAVSRQICATMKTITVIASSSRPPVASLLTTQHLKDTGSGLVSVEWGDSTMLEISDDLTLTTDHAIARHLARTYPGVGLYGKTALEASEVDHWLEFSTNSKNLGKAAQVLNKSLGPVTYLVGHSLTLADFAVWAMLKGDNQWQNMQKSFEHVCRWFTFCTGQSPFSQIPAHAFPQVQDQAVQSGTKMKAEGKYIELPGAAQGNVVTRFPPEASGYLHIGHAKAALLNQHYKNMYDGKMIMRFDDTNPAKESAEFEKVILDDLKMLNVTADMYTHTSDHFDTIMKYADKFVREGKAYCDDTPPDKMKEQREQRIKPINRDNSPEKNMQMWEEMKAGTDYGLTCCMRAKIDYQSDNGTMRDPTIYRCRPERHIRTGLKYK